MPKSITVLGLGAPSPGNTLLTIMNPFSQYAIFGLAPPVLDVRTVLSSPPATSVAADGQSAVVLVYRSKSSQPVEFGVSTSSTESSGSVGSLGSFDPNYLVNPNPASGNALTLPVNAPASGPDAAGVYTFLALLWAPDAMPVHGVFPVIDLAGNGYTGTTHARASFHSDPTPAAAARAWHLVRRRGGRVFYGLRRFLRLDHGPIPE